MQTRKVRKPETLPFTTNIIIEVRFSVRDIRSTVSTSCAHSYADPYHLWFDVKCCHHSLVIFHSV